MGAELLRRLVGRRTAPRPSEVSEAIEELRRRAKESPALAGAADFLRDALTGLYAEPIAPATPAMTSEQAATKLDGGVPLLRGEAVLLDASGFAHRWLHLCAILERHPEGRAATAVAEALRSGSLDPRALTEATLAGRPEAIHARARELGLDAALTATVLRLTLFPALSQLESDLARLRAARRWEHGYCPTCGSWPLLGEYRGLEQTRFLRCGLCAAAWEFPRLCCPFCKTTDHRELGYYYAEAEEGKYRAATCAVCRGYIKMVSTLSEFSAPGLLVADTATMHLDLVAADRGYRKDAFAFA